MRCENCINHLDEKGVNELGDDAGSQKIKDQYFGQRGFLTDHLKRGEKPVFCVWSYLVVGSKSVCVDIEVAEPEDDDNE